MQSRLHSLFESKANIIVGLPASYIINYFMLPLLSEPLANKEHWAFLVVSAVFTLVSMVRSYTLRRYFNHIGKKKTIEPTKFITVQEHPFEGGKKYFYSLDLDENHIFPLGEMYIDAKGNTSTEWTPELKRLQNFNNENEMLHVLKVTKPYNRYLANVQYWLGRMGALK